MGFQQIINRDKDNDSLNSSNKELTDAFESNRKYNNLELSSKDILKLIQNYEDSNKRKRNIRNSIMRSGKSDSNNFIGIDVQNNKNQKSKFTKIKTQRENTVIKGLLDSEEEKLSEWTDSLSSDMTDDGINSSSSSNENFVINVLATDGNKAKADMYSIKTDKNNMNKEINFDKLNIINEKTEVEVSLNQDFDPIKETIVNPPETYYKLPKYTSMLREFKQKHPLQFQNIMKYFSKPISRWKMHTQNKTEESSKIEIIPASKIFFNKRISKSIQTTENIDCDDSKSLGLSKSINRMAQNIQRTKLDSPRNVFTPSLRSRNQMQYRIKEFFSQSLPKRNIESNSKWLIGTMKESEVRHPSNFDLNFSNKRNQIKTSSCMQRNADICKEVKYFNKITQSESNTLRKSPNIIDDLNIDK